MNPLMNVFGDQIFTLTIGKHHGQQKNIGPNKRHAPRAPCNDSSKPAYFLRPPDVLTEQNLVTCGTMP